jgi:hypothetical protein
VAALVASGGNVRADDNLSQQLQGLFGQNGLTLAVGNPEFTHTAHFSSVSFEQLANLTQQLAPSAADFPAISTVPGFTYRYNGDIQAYERSSNSLGSIYVERPLTLGRGKFDFSVSYLYLDFDELDGTNLDELVFSGLRHGDCCDPIGNPNDPQFENATVDISFQEFQLRSHVVTLSGTYGIKDNWDVNVLLPIFTTSLDVTATAQINDVAFDPDGPGPLNFPNGVHNFNVENNPFCTDPTNCKRQSYSVSDEQSGVGDLQLRTKYHFLSGADGFNLAGGLNLRIPTGDEENFQGVDAVVLTPYVAMAREFGAFDLHGVLGIDTYTDDLDRSRARYAVGAAYQVLDNLNFIVDLVGTSQLTSNTISVSVPQFVGFETTPSSFKTETQELRTDIVDLAIGMKFNPYRDVVTFANVFVPLNDDGLRADVVPSAGVQVSF